MTDVKVGIIGCGGIARLHAAAYASAGAKMVSAWDVSPQASAALARETGARVAESIEEMLTKDKPDAVSVCTPPGAHLENCRPLLAAKVAVLCEKPMEANAESAARLAELAMSSGAPFMVAYCHRFHPPILKLRQLIREQELGEPLHFRNIFAGYLRLEGNHRLNPAVSGGGCVIDNGSHAVDLFRFLVGEPTHVQARIGRLRPNLPIEDFAVLHLDGPGNAHGEVTLSYSFKVSESWVEWYGSKGTAAVSYWNSGFPDLAYRVEGQDQWTPVDCSPEPDRFAGEVLHFLECCRTGAAPRVSAEDGLAASRIVAAAYRSALEGKLVALS
ncbi:MAG TPA: Gfo/Idh/MocA family oxidoreductase [Polyangiaceae bacterium]|jgi:predicted dehydrogenase